MDGAVRRWVCTGAGAGARIMAFFGNSNFLSISDLHEDHRTDDGSAWGDYDCATTWMAVLQFHLVRSQNQDRSPTCGAGESICTSGNKGQSNYYKHLHKIVVNHFGIHELDYPAGKACTRRIWALHYILPSSMSRNREVCIFPLVTCLGPSIGCTCATTTICTATLLFIIPKLSVQICRYACMSSRIAMPDCTKIQ